MGHQFVFKDPCEAHRWQLENPWTSAGHARAGYRLLQRSIGEWAKRVVDNVRDICIVWVNSGELLEPTAVAALRQLDKPVVLYRNDDLTGGRDGRRFDSLLRALPQYGL